MPAPLEIIVTNAGRAAIVNAQNTGTAPVTIAQIGLSAMAITPLPTAVVLPGEIKRVATIAGEVVANDTIHVTLTDESADPYTLRSLALYLGDGTLFAIYGQAAPVLEKTAQSIAALSIDVIFADIAAAALTFGNANFTNPPATTERQGVVELATVAEAQAGIDALRALTPANAKAAILGWLLSQDGSGSGLDSDLFEGQHGDYYTNIPERLGYVPWGPNNDGSGSGLDAGLLAGQPASYYTNIIARLTYTPLDKAGDTMTGRLTLIDVANYFDKDGSGYPYWQWDGGDFMRFQRDTNTLEVKINNVTAMLMRGSTGALDLYATALQRNSNTVWDAGNDGSGSGLDAGLFAGQLASYYTNITARLGYTAANKAGETFTGPVSVAPGNAFSVNADATKGGIQMVAGDNIRSGYINLFAPGSVRVGYLGFAQLGGAIAYSNDTGGGHAFAGGQLSRDGSKVFDAGNDGSGSGLDADMWRGQTPAQMFDASLSGSGYQKLPSGLIMQWGFPGSHSSGGQPKAVAFAQPFPNGVLSLTITPANNSTTTRVAWSDTVTNSGFNLRCDTPNIGCYYIAFGY